VGGRSIMRRNTEGDNFSYGYCKFIAERCSVRGKKEATYRSGRTIVPPLKYALIYPNYPVIMAPIYPFYLILAVEQPTHQALEYKIT
jgi:hypothetical protein